MLKLNLECSEILRNGYTNVNSFAPPNVDFANLKNLQPLLQNEKADEIIFNPFLNILGPNEIFPVISHWRDSLSDSGNIKLQYIDIYRMSDYISRGSISYQDLHRFIYGNNKEYNSILDDKLFKKLALDIGMSVQEMSSQNFFVTVQLGKNAKD
jgi:hypothetical protein